jgi:aminomethyltransferase
MTERAAQLRRTPLARIHEKLGATMTAFAGWLMPLRYGSESAEHAAVRSAAGLFDLSHMGEIAVAGPGAADALDYALVSQLSALAPGRARYTMICAEDGGVIDDLIVYRLAAQEYLVVANAANTAVVAAELARRAEGRGADVTDRTGDCALIAVQGPAAAAILGPLTDASLAGLRYYGGQRASLAGAPVMLARTGYTGEDGFEIFARTDDAARLWEAIADAGAGLGLVPAGLAARDTLRLEAGMPLYGNELTREVTPFDAGLGRVVKLDKPGPFVGREALARRAGQPPRRVLAGLIVRSRRVPRHGYPVLHGGDRCGTVTSGAPSPTLGVPIAMAYLDPQAAEAAGPARRARDAVPAAVPAPLTIDIRGRAEPADLAALPFYRRPGQ